MDPVSLATNVISVATFIQEKLHVMKTNIKQAQRLSERLQKLGTSLNSYRGDPNGNFHIHVAGIKTLLEEIRKYIEKLSSKSYVFQLVNGGSVTDHFEDFSAQLKAHCDDLQVSGMVGLQNWITENKEDTKSDEALLATIAAEIEKNSDKISAQMGSNQSEMLAMMNNLYERLDQGLYNNQRAEKDIAVAIANALQNYTRRKNVPSEEKTNVIPEWVIEHNAVVIMDEIGGGGFATVYKGRYENSEVAVKKFKKSSKDEIELIFQEAKLWQSLRHNNVLPLIGACLDPESPFLISPLCHHGTMKSFLKTQDYPVNLGIKFMYQIAAGMGYLHSRNIIHNDLKALNVLIDKAEDAKVSDFGTSAVKRANTAGKTTFKAVQEGGTQRWMAPERLKDDDLVTKASDVYSYAMTCYEIVSCGKIPFDKVADDLLRERIVNDQKKLSKPPQLSLYESKADFVWGLIMECSAYEPEHRPRFSSIVIKLESMYQEVTNQSTGRKSPSPSRQLNSGTMKTSDSIVSKQLKNPEARNFWIRNCGEDKMQVTWPKFYEFLCSEFPDLQAKDNEKGTQLAFDPNRDGVITLSKVRNATEKLSLTEIIDSIKIMTLADKMIQQSSARMFWIENFGENQEFVDWLFFIEILSCSYTFDYVAIQELLQVDDNGQIHIKQWNLLTRENQAVQDSLNNMKLSDQSHKDVSTPASTDMSKPVTNSKPSNTTSVVSKKLTDGESKEFWIKYIGADKLQTTWKEFYSHLYKEYPSLQTKNNEAYIKQIFDPNNDGLVTLIAMRNAVNGTLTQLIEGIPNPKLSDRIKNSQAKAFWKENFGELETVEWRTFHDFLSDEIKFDKSCLKTTLCGDRDIVDINEWARVTGDYSDLGAFIASLKEHQVDQGASQKQDPEKNQKEQKISDNKPEPAKNHRNEQRDLGHLETVKPTIAIQANSPKTKQEAKELSAPQNGSQALEQGMKEFELKKYTDAINHFKIASEKGLTKAQTKLGYMFRNGLGCERNYKDAYKFYSMAADKRDCDAEFALAEMYWELDKNVLDARRYYKLAAESGHQNAVSANQKLNLLLQSYSCDQIQDAICGGRTDLIPSIVANLIRDIDQGNDIHIIHLLYEQFLKTPSINSTEIFRKIVKHNHNSLTSVIENSIQQTVVSDLIRPITILIYHIDAKYLTYSFSISDNIDRACHVISFPKKQISVKFWKDKELAASLCAAQCLMKFGFPLGNSSPMLALEGKQLNGDWVGSYVAEGQDCKWKVKIQVKMNDNVLTAKGTDGVGPFTLSGKCSQIGELEYSKTYSELSYTWPSHAMLLNLGLWAGRWGEDDNEMSGSLVFVRSMTKK